MTSDDDELLRRWCEGEEAAGDALWTRRVGVKVEQRLISGCARCEAKSCERFAQRYLAGLDAGLLRRVLAEGRVAKLCERQSGDLPLLTRFAAGNMGAGDVLFRRYYGALDRFVASKVSDASEASDIVQETFRDLSRQYQQIKAFRPFMFRVAANKIGAWFTKRFQRPTSTGTTGISELPEAKGIETREEERLERKMLLMALRSLTLDEQMVLELYTWEEFTAEEVAKIVGIQVHDVRHVLRGAKKKMRDFIAACGHGEVLRASTGELARFVEDLRRQT